MCTDIWGSSYYILLNIIASLYPPSPIYRESSFEIPPLFKFWREREQVGWVEGWWMYKRKELKNFNSPMLCYLPYCAWDALNSKASNKYTFELENSFFARRISWCWMTEWVSFDPKSTFAKCKEHSFSRLIQEIFFHVLRKTQGQSPTCAYLRQFSIWTFWDWVFFDRFVVALYFQLNLAPIVVYDFCETMMNISDCSEVWSQGPFDRIKYLMQLPALVLLLMRFKDPSLWINV